MPQLPPIAPLPPPEIQKHLTSTSPQQWQSFLKVYTSILDLYLTLPEQDFAETAIRKGESTTLPFIQSYLVSDSTHGEAALHRLVYVLAHRILASTSEKIPASFLDWRFLAGVCRTFRRIAASSLQVLLVSVFERKDTASSITRSLDAMKKQLIKDLESSSPSSSAISTVLSNLSPLTLLSPDAASVFTTGSDLVDALASAYPQADDDTKSSTTVFLYSCLSHLIHGSPSHPANLSLLSDHLYSLKAASSSAGDKSLLADLVTNTNIQAAIRNVTSEADRKRADNLVNLLSPFHDEKIRRRRRPAQSHKVSKGKGKAPARNGDVFGHGSSLSQDDGVHIHRMALITQLQDLFPDLGAGFAMKLLAAYDDNLEQATAALLEENIPPSLAEVDRSEPLATEPTAQEAIDHLAPRPTPPQSPRAAPVPTRRNIYDNDELDRLSVETGRLHIGGQKAANKMTADEVLARRDPNSHATHKAAILSALSAFDADDDEHDDTYDVDDAGVAGTIDNTHGGDGDMAADAHEESLYQAWKLSPEVFDRDSGTRRSKGRAALKQETHMTDEAIEGWAIMLVKDARRARRLEAKYATFSGQQQSIERTSWRASGEEGSADEGSGRGRGRGRGPSRGFFRGAAGPGRGGAGNVAGEPSDSGTQRARQRKDANKGSRANHNRRDQRAKKMARGGLAG